MNESLVFLKLGGSLITDKEHPHHAQVERIDQIAQEIHEALNLDPSLRLLVGHGSGSFGHVPAQKYKTRQGVHTRQEWIGFSQVWSEAHALNQIVLERFQAAGLPVISFPPSASVLAKNRSILDWNLFPMIQAISQGLLPLVFGDVIFDQSLGGTILSTEEIFVYLALMLHPQRILITGEEEGVWEDFPACQHLLPMITPDSYPQLSSKIFGSQSTDVTGGMATKVSLMLELVKQENNLEVNIFSPRKFGMLKSALSGKQYGTVIKNY